MRVKLGITQKQLANMIDVSTSMINQIESGRSQPSYKTAKKIFDNLATLEGKLSPNKAEDICYKNIIKLKPTNSLHEAIKQMRKHSISQIPIFNGTKVFAGVLKSTIGGAGSIISINLIFFH